MRRMRRFFAALFVLVLFGRGMVCIPVQGAKVRTVAAETRDPYRPVEVQSYTWGDFDVIHIMRTYRLSPIDDPAGIPTKDFEERGWVYHMVEMRREEETGTDTRQITRTVTKASDTDDMKKILRQLDATLNVTTEDGFSGTLRLDHTSVSVEAAGYETRDSGISATRLYPNLSDADLSLIPKTVEENGKTLTLDDVQWENAWQTEEDGAYIRYSATATYVGTTSSRQATGYTVSASYSGEVSRSDVEMVTYYVDFAPVREAEQVTVPPQPEIPDEPIENKPTENDAAPDVDPEDTEQTPEDFPENDAEDDREAESAGTGGKELDSSEEADHERGEQERTESSSNPPDGGASVTVQPDQTARSAPTAQRSGPDYSGLKRTLLSGGLLIALALAAYGVRKFKEKRGNSA